MSFNLGQENLGRNLAPFGQGDFFNFGKYKKIAKKSVSEKIPYTKNDEFLTLKVKEKIFADANILLTSRKKMCFFTCKRKLLEAAGIPNVLAKIPTFLS